MEIPLFVRNGGETPAKLHLHKLISTEMSKEETKSIDKELECIEQVEVSK